LAVDVAPIGSVGHLVGATLETVGHFLQSQLLDLFTPVSPYGRSLAVLLWVASAFVALTFYVYTGKAKFTLTFLIGPALFFFLVAVRTQSQGAEWRFGRNTFDRERIVSSAVDTAGLRATSSTYPKANVSWVFSTYNKVVSGIVQILVSSIEVISKDGAVSFLTKAERYERLFRPAVSDGSLRWFLSGVMIPNCSDYFVRMKGYLDPNENILSRTEIAKTLDARGKAAAITRADHGDVFTWLEREGIYPYATQETLSCDELWNAGVSALVPEATKYIETTLQRDLPTGYDPETFRASLTKKFSTRYVASDGKSAASLTNEQKFMLVINEVAGRMLLTELKGLQPDLLEIHFGSDGPITQDGMVFNKQFSTRSIRRIFQTDVGEEKGDYLMAMLSLPYVQGMLILFLSVTFPFAALVSVIPGKHTAIIFWMGLWMWAKSWDVGFAAVMFVDNILFQLFPHGTPISGDVLVTPWKAMKALIEVDPAYSVYTYYHLLATCIGAVPLLTGLFIKRAGGQIIGGVKNSLTSFAGKLGGTVGAYRAAALAQTQIAKTMGDIYSTMERAMNNAKFDPIVAQARQNMSRAMVDIAANKAGGLQSAAKAAENAFEMHKGILQARMNYLGQSAYANATSDEDALLGSVDAIVSLFNSHDLVDRVWTGDAEIAMDKATLGFSMAQGATPLFAGGLSLTNSIFGNQYNSYGSVNTYLSSIIPDVQATWSPESISRQVKELQEKGRDAEDIAPGVARAFGPQVGETPFLKRKVN